MRVCLVCFCLVLLELFSTWQAGVCFVDGVGEIRCLLDCWCDSVTVTDAATVVVVMMMMMMWWDDTVVRYVRCLVIVQYIQVMFVVCVS